MRKFNKEFLPAALVKSAILKTKLVPRPTPTVFYFPGLNTKPIFDPAAFEFTDILKTNEKILLQEYQQLANLQIKSDYDLRPDEHALHEGQWVWSSYIKKGTRDQTFMDKCPHTARLIDSIPRIMDSTPFGSAFFSTLNPKASIRPHNGPCNLRIRCHFPLIVPEGKKCGIRIGNEVVHWEVGKPLIFDDCFEHEVWNDSDEPRVVLLFDTWYALAIAVSPMHVISSMTEVVVHTHHLLIFFVSL